MCMFDRYLRLKAKQYASDTTCYVHLFLQESSVASSSVNPKDSDPLVDPQKQSQGDDTSKVPLPDTKASTTDDQPSGSNTESKSPTLTKKIWDCKPCNKVFSTLKLLRKHKNKVHTVTDESGVYYPCAKCGERFTIATKRDQHWIQCAEYRPHACKICQKTFRARASLIAHSRTHTGELPFACEICGKGYKAKDQLIIHVRMHKGERPFSCSICGKGFTSGGNLYSHQLSHSEGKHSCSFCGKKFTTRTCLEKHVRKHTGEKPFQCHICGKNFSQKNKLDAHAVVHSGEKPVECKICKQKFSHKTAMARHLRVHSGERPYSCDVCDKSFFTRGELTTHTMSHTGVKPHTCSQCGRGFLRPSLLHKHREQCFPKHSKRDLPDFPYPSHPYV